MASSNTRPRQPPDLRMIQNFHLVWLDRSVDEENDDNRRNFIAKLQQVVNIVHTFIDLNECIDFITDTHEEMTSIIISGEVIQFIALIVQEIPQVNAIYIFSENKAQHMNWVKECFKVKGVFTDITTICGALKQAADDYEHNSVSISFVKSTDTTLKQKLDTLDQSFMYTQILKEILLTIDFDQSHIHAFLTYCREQLVGNTMQLANVDKIAKEYHDHEPIWWYTYESLLYSMVNRALRLMEVDRIVMMGFFIRDLHSHIAKLHAEQYSGQNHSDSFIVYRGQGLFHTVFDEINATQGGLMSFNNFLSTSLDKAVSHAFAESITSNPDLIGVLFKININPSTPSSPFANVQNVSYFQREEEILFSMHSVFRIGQLQQIDGNNRLYQVDLTLTSDNDPQLHALTKSIQEETSPGEKWWLRLGQLMIKIGQFNQAEELYNILLERKNNECEMALLYHHLGLVKNNLEKYTEAIQFYEKALETLQKTLPVNHPRLAPSYNNIGEVYRNMGDYSKALSYYGKALEISQKTLPANHPDLANLYNNIGMMYYNMGQYLKALSYYEKALEIYQKTLPANHPRLATSYNNIGLVKDNQGQYTEAVQFYEKALEIRQKTLPLNHLDLASSYNNIGMLYYNMEKYSKAVSYYEKALEIYQKTLPANHPRLATSYNNIAGMYIKTGEYSKAVPHHEKAFEIDQKTLPANHPDLFSSYNNMGALYYNTGDYSKALAYCEHALDNRQHSLPPNHPDIRHVKKNIEAIKKKL